MTHSTAAVGHKNSGSVSHPAMAGAAQETVWHLVCCGVSSSYFANVGLWLTLTCDDNTGEDAAPQADQSIVEHKGHGVPQHLCNHSMT
jgi:hypothetical protein